MGRRVLVTAALPYANGSIHLGHLLEAVQTDVYVRARRLMGDDVVFVWADDAHGTPIQVRALKEGITPEALVARAYEEHVSVYRDFQISFDVYHSTHSAENRRHAEHVWSSLKSKGDIDARSIEQLYCPHDKMFLPDRFVRGTCPKCGSADQYGDSCEVCGSTYSPTELHTPRCNVCGTTPELRSSVHFFVDLAKHEGLLREWLRAPEEGGKTVLQSTVRNYVLRWVDDGLRDWDVSRDAPYFGFEIPEQPGKYFYVWFDAPIGYVSATEKLCTDTGRSFDAYWRATREDTEIVHVIGKDIVYFHCLFWPVLLARAGYTTPSRVQVHGWLMVNGKKMSKSEGTFVLGRTYLDHLPPDYLRYYLAAKLSPSQEDFNLDLEDFAGRVNGDLVNRAANLASRVIKFVGQRLGGTVGALPEDAAGLVAGMEEKFAAIPAAYANFDSARALELTMGIAEDANTWITAEAPWKLAQSDPERARAVCSVGVFASQLIAAALAPVLPTWAEKLARTLNLPAPLDFVNATQRLPAGHVLAEYETLAERLDPAKLSAIIAASRESLEPAVPTTTATPAAPATPSAPTPKTKAKPVTDPTPPAATPAPAPATDTAASPAADALAPETTIDAFGAIDLRVAKVLAAETVEGSDKLLRLTLDLGAHGQRNVFSGIRKSYPEPEALVGRHVVVFANLKPRKMRFGVSEGMVLAAGGADDAVTVLELDPRSVPGDRIS
jgi:methionyl-tRNA synthetase